MPVSKSESSLNSTVSKLSTNTGYTESTVATSGPTLSDGSRNAIQGTRWEAMDNEIDANLSQFNFAVFFFYM